MITVLVYQSSFFFSFSESSISSKLKLTFILLCRLMLGIINILSCPATENLFLFFCCHEILVHLFFFLSLSRLLTVAIFFVLIMFFFN